MPNPPTRAPAKTLRARSFLGLALLSILLFAGCGETALQESAHEVAAQEAARSSRYDTDELHCTRGAGTWFAESAKTRVYLCAVRVKSGGCDWFQVESRPVVRSFLRDRDAGCVLPR